MNDIKPYEKFTKELENSDSLRRLFPNIREYERFISTARQVCIQEGLLIPDATEAYYRSLMKAISQIASVGLLPGKIHQHVDLHIEKGEIVCRPQYQGLIELCMRSEKLTTIFADVVYSGDIFEDRGPLSEPLHKRAFEDRGKRIGAYCVAVFRDGTKVCEIAGENEIQKVKSMAKTQAIWCGAFGDEMAKKVPLKRLMKRLPKPDTWAEISEWDNEEYNLQSNTGNKARNIQELINDSISKTGD